MTIKPVKMQSLSYVLGQQLADRFCAPLAFFMVLRAYGYLGKTVDPARFCETLDHESLTVATRDWSRPALTKYFRKKYKAPMVSWVVGGEEIYGGVQEERMIASGYVESKVEKRFYWEHIHGRSVEQIVRAGHPVIVTMTPGFGSPDNKNIHAVVLARWTDDEVLVFDPDARNTELHFKPEHVLKFISHGGAGTVVLPPR